MSQAFYTSSSNGKNHDEEESFQERLRARGREVLSEASSRVSELLSSVGESADRGLASLGDASVSAADVVRNRAPSFASPASDPVADALERGGEYLQENSLKEITDDAAGMIRRRPIRTMLLGFGVGFVLARTISRRS